MLAVRLKLRTQKANLMKDPNCATVLRLRALRMSNLFTFQLFRTEIEIPSKHQQTCSFLWKGWGFKVQKGTNIGVASSPFWGQRCHRAVQISFARRVLCIYTISLCHAYVLLDPMLGVYVFGSKFQNGPSSFKILLSRQEMTKRFRTFAHEAPDRGSEHQNTDESLIY